MLPLSTGELMRQFDLNSYELDVIWLLGQILMNTAVEIDQRYSGILDTIVLHLPFVPMNIVNYQEHSSNDLATITKYVCKH